MARLPWSFLVAAASLLALAFVLLQDSFDSPDAHNALWAPGSVGHSSSLLDTQDAIVEARVQQLLAKERARLGLSAAGRDSGPEDSDAGTGHALASAVQHGEVIMPKLPNATAKAELGRASWKLLHTMAARFPEEPTSNQREAFAAWLHLFSRLYPCGECAAEFQQLLRQHPPQTSSRGAASLYLCHLHNLVNARLGKDEYDCGTNLRDVYDCGCGDEEERERERVRDKGRGERRAAGEEEQEQVRRDPATGLELVGG
ncbi:ERV/ALR sulfhydryl oxidase domain-containing protein [Rhodotorula diobovata]|uniref:Sulfhydryl oxidase n=1 Tax=Rhodotorula diobovata TaxID=5288 RepID=A0A5C5G207_9BASI|nr:ERV/ALR sulfhydryl oxidase domain-containing protein [Rhodotorula diobovata]